jgi:hypothetical protein
VNRLEDSFLLWGRVCGAKLLAKTTIVLFTNKIDLLEKKLVVGPDGKGKRVKDWLTSYGDRPNTAADVTKCAYSIYLAELMRRNSYPFHLVDLLGKFKDAQSRLSPEKRPFYGYPTSVVNTRATQKTLVSSMFARPSC